MLRISQTPTYLFHTAEFSPSLSVAKTELNFHLRFGLGKNWLISEGNDFDRLVPGGPWIAWRTIRWPVAPSPNRRARAACPPLAAHRRNVRAASTPGHGIWFSAEVVIFVVKKPYFLHCYHRSLALLGSSPSLGKNGPQVEYLALRHSWAPAYLNHK